MNTQNTSGSSYQRYDIFSNHVPDLVRWPSRFKVDIKKIGLLKLLLKEIIHYRGRKDVILSRPCMYGVFSGPVGGFSPREDLCVGCLRCTTEFPDFVAIRHNPERQRLGESFFTFNYVDTLTYEAQTGMIPVKGAGYRGKFGGEGWDGMWTDMSEIVRPTRDGIHGREFISTVVDIGYKPAYLTFDEHGAPTGEFPNTISLPLPILFDAVECIDLSSKFWEITSQTAAEIGSLAAIPIAAIRSKKLTGEHIIPVVSAEEIKVIDGLAFLPKIIEMDGWDENFYKLLQTRFPESLIALRTPFASPEELLGYAENGVRIFHLLADFHGRGREDMFVLDMIRAAHKTFVDAGIREEVTLLGSGGMIAAEHVPKAILCGLDAVAVDTPALVALQVEFIGECSERAANQFRLPKNLSVDWGVQRLTNLSASWRDQLLEILGAMGLREVRRLRGEMGRAMFMLELEAEAFAEVEGYPHA